jgi:hypothetical protein
MRSQAAIIGVVSVVALAAGAAQAAQPSVWQGSVFYTAVTPACTASDTAAVDDAELSVYRPRFGSQTEPEGLSVITTRSGFVITAARTTLRGAVSYKGVSISSHAETHAYTGSSNLKITPAVINAHTPVVEITGVIDNFFDTAGCNVTVRAVLGLRP